MAQYLFINRELGWAGKGRRMAGFQGNGYGEPCRWNQEHQAQAVTLELTPAEYQKVIFDLARCWHLAMRKWIPLPMEDAARPTEVEEFHAGYTLAMDGKPLPEVTSRAMAAGYNIVSARAVDTDTELRSVRVKRVVDEGVSSGRITQASADKIDLARLDKPLSSQEIEYANELAERVAHKREEFLKGLSEKLALPLENKAGEIIYQPSTSVVAVAAPEIHVKMNWLKLKKIAKDESVSLEGVKGNPAIVEAILSHREERYRLSLATSTPVFSE